MLFASSTIAQPIPGLRGNELTLEDIISAEAGVLDFLVRLFLPQLAGSQSRGENGVDLVRVGANLLRAFGSGGNNNNQEDIDVRGDFIQDPRVLNFGEEIGRRNQIQRNFQINPNQLATLSRLFSGFLSILR